MCFFYINKLQTIVQVNEKKKSLMINKNIIEKIKR